MSKLIALTVICVISALLVEAQKREKVELVPLSFRGDVCDHVCNKRDGWERCEKVQKRGQWEVTCTDTRPSPPGRINVPPLPPPRPTGPRGH
ncbi:hypothetical protein OESDEN_20495 [Oesophagostomum dentatum]|uniref:Uncharacterized protein n=1 Tax=Oesophagostomum dentatum TaxID=61180 RepID=A0A0B1S9E0_OESDE|nr:hypothetical protein OESDEN_20495 [Oesophagostomum dentatum]